MSYKIIHKKGLEHPIGFDTLDGAQAYLGKLSGDYELEMPKGHDPLKERIKELEKECRGWEERVQTLQKTIHAFYNCTCDTPNNAMNGTNICTTCGKTISILAFSK